MVKAHESRRQHVLVSGLAARPRQRLQHHLPAALAIPGKIADTSPPGPLPADNLISLWFAVVHSTLDCYPSSRSNPPSQAAGYQKTLPRKMSQPPHFRSEERRVGKE